MKVCESIQEHTRLWSLHIPYVQFHTKR